MKPDKKIEIEFLIMFASCVIAGIVRGIKTADFFSGIMAFVIALGIYLAVRPIVTYWYKRFMEWAGDIF